MRSFLIKIFTLLHFDTFMALTLRLIRVVARAILEGYILWKQHTLAILLSPRRNRNKFSWLIIAFWT